MATMAKMIEQGITIYRVDRLPLCGLCIEGDSAECHTPGCVLYLSSVPDLLSRERIEAYGGTITKEPEPEEVDDDGDGDA